MKGNIFTTNTLLIRPILGPVVYITGKLIQKGILKKVNVKDIWKFSYKNKNVIIK